MPAEDLRKMERVDERTFLPDSAEGLARSFTAALTNPDEDPETLARFWSASAPQAQLKALLASMQGSVLSGTQNISASVARDALLANAKISTERNGDDGFRVLMSFRGNTTALLAVREKSGLKLLGNAGLSEGVARRALSDLQAGHGPVARQWLDWLRDGIKLRSEDDPLGGPAFPRLWNKGVSAPPSQIRYAAASLIVSRDALPILKEAVDTELDAARKAYFELAFVNVCESLGLWADGLPVAKRLATSYPSSDTARLLLAEAYAGTGEILEAQQMLKWPREEVMMT